MRIKVPASATYVVELDRGVWLATWEGDPGRTLVHGNAKQFRSLHAAALALLNARKFRPFEDAAIVSIGAEVAP